MAAGCGGGVGKEDCGKFAADAYQAVDNYCVGRTCCVCECVTQGKYPDDSSGTCTCTDRSETYTFVDGRCTLELLNYYLDKDFLERCLDGLDCTSLVIDTIDTYNSCGS